MPFTTTELLDDVRVRGAISSASPMFTDARLLKMAHSEMLDYLLPLIMKTRESYYLYDADTAINASGQYPIHTRAVGGKLENVSLIDASPTPTTRRDVVRASEDEIEDYGASFGGRSGFFIKRNMIHLIPATGGGYPYLRQSFYLRPGYFVSTDEAAQVTAINTGTKTVTFSTVPSGWSTSDTFDFIQAEPHFDTLDISKAAGTVTTGASGSIVFSDTLPTRLAVGDWVCLAGETCIVQAPLELHPMLAQRVANKAMQSLGDTESLKAGMKDLQDLEERILRVLTPRVDKENKKLVNRSGLLRRN